MLNNSRIYRAGLLLLISAASLVHAGNQSPTNGKPEAVSSLGAKLYRQPPDEKRLGALAEAEKKLAADPKNVELIIALGRAQADLWRFNDAIATYTRGIDLAPDNWMLLRHRGHRYITIRRIEPAIKDLQHAAKLNDKSYDVWYHLGLAHYLKGNWKAASAAYEKGLRVVLDKTDPAIASVENDDSLIAISDWLYMTYRRAKRDADAAQVLERITGNMRVKENVVYYDRLLFYKGLKKEEDMLSEKASDLQVATVGYGIGNWYLYSGNPTKAREHFQKIVSGKYWPAFGFIAAEAELARKR